VTALKEHREFEKEFEINTKFEGEKALGRTKVFSEPEFAAAALLSQEIALLYDATSSLHR